VHQWRAQRAAGVDWNGYSELAVVLVNLIAFSLNMSGWRANEWYIVGCFENELESIPC
jgi:hypothetical protein